VALTVAQVITAVIMIGHVSPYARKGQNQVETFNEVVIMFVVYHMICFTPFIWDLEMKYNLGYSVCSLVSFHLIVNFSVLTKSSFRGSRLSYRKR